MEPRPFDLLVYLVEHSDRVVPKDELRKVLWNEAPVSSGAIAQAVKKVRQVIGDDASDPLLVKTIQRAGYRFVGELIQTLRASAPEVPPLPSNQAPDASRVVVSLALLPFENRTGQPELGWIELGLMSLVARSLETERRLSLPPIPMVLSAVATMPARADAAERCGMAARLLGVRDVVHATVDLDGDTFQLEFGIGTGKTTRLAGSELTTLGQQMARSLQAQLFPAAERTAAVCLEFQDPLANQAMARCMQAVGMEKWREALNLIDVLLDIEPGHPGVLLEKMRVLVAMDNCAAFTLGTDLLATLQDPDSRFAAEIHLILADAYMKRRLVVEAQRHLDASLRAATSPECSEWLLRAGLLRASIAISIPDLPAAARLLDALEPACDREDRNQLHRMRFLTLKAMLSGVSGRHAESLPIMRRLVDLQRTLGMRPGLGRSLSNLTLVMTQLGHLHEAAAHGEESLALTLEANMPTSIALSAVVLCRVYQLLRRPLEMERVVQVFGPLQLEGERFNPAYRLSCEGMHATALGQHAQAVAHWREARMHLKQARHMVDHHTAFNDLVAALFAAGQVDMAMAACAEERDEAPSEAGLNGSLIYWNAQRSFLEGNRMLACRHLRQAADMIPDGLWRANARIDAAWLLLEMGDPRSARDLLRAIEPWLRDYPPGMAVQARLLYAEEQYDAAAALQERTLAHQTVDDPFHCGLAAAYAKAARRPPPSVPPVPLAPRLPTMI